MEKKFTLIFLLKYIYILRQTTNIGFKISSFIVKFFIYSKYPKSPGNQEHVHLRENVFYLDDIHF